MNATTSKASNEDSSTSSSAGHSDCKVSAPVDHKKVPAKLRRSWKKPAVRTLTTALTDFIVAFSPLSFYRTTPFTYVQGMPRRPLSAYNLFFQEQRKKLLGGAADDVENSGCSKRKHRKRHGKIGFADLAKSISQKWHNLQKEEKYTYENEAKIRKQAYFQQVHEYKKRKHNTELELAYDRKTRREEAEDSNQSDYAAVLISLSRGAHGHSGNMNQDSKTEVTTSEVSSADNSNEKGQRTLFTCEDSVHHQTKQALANQRQECIDRLFQPSLGAVPSNTGFMTNPNLGRYALSAVPIINNAYQQQQVQRILLLDREEEKLLYPELIKSIRPTVLSPLGRPWQNSIRVVDPRLVAHYQGPTLLDISQQPITSVSSSNAPVRQSNYFIGSSAAFPQIVPVQSQNHTLLAQHSFAGNLPDHISPQQHFNLQNTMLSSQLQPQAQINLRRMHRS